MCTSVPQMAVLSTRITTSPAPALGTGTLSSARPGPRWFLTSASMDSTASPSVRRLSCGERPRQLIEACPLAFHLGAQFVQARRHRTEASLPAQVVVERGLVRAGVDAVTLAVEHLVQREEAAGQCEADELDALGGLRLPARRAGRQHEQEAEARHAQSQPDLAQEVVTVSERQRRRVGDAMRGHDRHDVLLGLGLAARGRGRLGAARRGAAALPPGVSVDLVVVADVQDIFVALAAAAERNEDVLYICYDNEIYGNTGGQRSGATPRGAKTTTTPHGKAEAKKDIMAIMAAHRVPYAATLSLAHRDDFLRKIRLALGMPGFRFLLMLSPCPAGWKSQPAESVELVRLAVACGLFPLYEVFDGECYRINARPDETPLDDYLCRQGRFRSVAPSLDELRAQVEREWARLDELARAFPATQPAD